MHFFFNIGGSNSDGSRISCAAGGIYFFPVFDKFAATNVFHAPAFSHLIVGWKSGLRYNQPALSAEKKLQSVPERC